MYSILGLAGTKSIINELKLIEKENKYKNIKICRHNFSIGTKDKPSQLSHNQKIENEENCELEYYQLIYNLREKGINIISFTQGSSNGNISISRYSGIKLKIDRNILEGNTYLQNPDNLIIELNHNLATILNNSIYKNTIIKEMKNTHQRKGYYGCFLHDVKVYFVSCNFDYLLDNDIIIEKSLYITEDNLINDYRKNELDTEFQEYIVNPNKIYEYSSQFNIWLHNIFNTDYIPDNIDLVISDPGFGYKINKNIVLKTKTELKEEIDKYQPNIDLNGVILQKQINTIQAYNIDEIVNEILNLNDNK